MGFNLALAVLLLYGGPYGNLKQHRQSKAVSRCLRVCTVSKRK